MVLHDEENGMRRWAWIAPLLVMLLMAAAGCSPSTPGTPISAGSRIHVTKISNTVLQVLSAGKVASQPASGEWIDSVGGESLSTAETGYGYVQLGFPEQVDLYLASGTETSLKHPADERVSLDVLLTGGWLLASLPDSFPADQRVVVESPEGGQAWISGSMLGAQYLSSTHELYVDCLKGQCGYTDGTGGHSLPEGSHVSLNGRTLLNTGPGNHNELWQFVPNLVAAPTVAPSATPNVAATQSCRYFMSLGLSCTGGFPTLTATPSATPNAAATQECWRHQKLGTPCP